MMEQGGAPSDALRCNWENRVQQGVTPPAWEELTWHLGTLGLED